MRTNVVDSQDVRMVQRRDRPCFLYKTPQSIGVISQRLWQHFDRDIPPEPGIPRAVHLAHAARACWCHDLLRTEFGARGERHLCAQL
jgi:hypothetical protein